MENEEIQKALSELTNKVDALYKIVEKDSGVIEKESEALEKGEIKIEKTLNNISDKFDEVIRLFKDKKENVEIKIKENPVAYITGTLIGGILIGFLIGKSKEEREK